MSCQPFDFVSNTRIGSRVTVVLVTNAVRRTRGSQDQHGAAARPTPSGTAHINDHLVRTVASQVNECSGVSGCSSFFASGSNIPSKKLSETLVLTSRELTLSLRRTPCHSEYAQENDCRCSHRDRAFHHTLPGKRRTSASVRIKIPTLPHKPRQGWGTRFFHFHLPTVRRPASALGRDGRMRPSLHEPTPGPDPASRWLP
jgi:hypothetical protein